MKSRIVTKNRILVIVVLLALVLPVSLLAQEEGVTLGGLSESVQELTSDFNIFSRDLVRINDRLDALENQVVAFAEAQHYDEPGENEENRACILAAKEYGHLNSVNQLRAETINGYLEKYGQSLPGVGLYDVRFFSKQDVMEMKYKPYDKDLYILSVTERWQRCVFLGYEFEERKPRE